MRHEYRKMWRDRQGYRMAETYCGMEITLCHEKRPREPGSGGAPCPKCVAEIRKKNPAFLPRGVQ